ncbi:hypothetical protein BJV82DRAFT_575645 [Fennellomyces sp. T-0311]|nr:hypothetical protein BJV82DRAFT_575645 [Fennellomyces sp. T-0311]
MTKSFETQELEFINEKRNRPIFTVDLHEIPKQWYLEDPSSIKVIDAQLLVDEQLERLIAIIKDKLRLVDIDQGRVNLLQNLEEVVDAKTEILDPTEVTFHDSVTARGRPKKTKDSTFPSRFELEEKDPTVIDWATGKEDIVNQNNATEDESPTFWTRKRDKEDLGLKRHNKTRTELLEEKQFDFLSTLQFLENAFKTQYQLTATAGTASEQLHTLPRGSR